MKCTTKASELIVPSCHSEWQSADFKCIPNGNFFNQLCCGLLPRNLVYFSSPQTFLKIIKNDNYPLFMSLKLQKALYLFSYYMRRKEVLRRGFKKSFTNQYYIFYGLRVEFLSFTTGCRQPKQTLFCKQHNISPLSACWLTFDSGGLEGKQEQGEEQSCFQQHDAVLYFLLDAKSVICGGKGEQSSVCFLGSTGWGSMLPLMLSPGFHGKGSRSRSSVRCWLLNQVQNPG